MVQEQQSSSYALLAPMERLGQSSKSGNVIDVGVGGKVSE